MLFFSFNVFLTTRYYNIGTHKEWKHPISESTKQTLRWLNDVSNEKKRYKYIYIKAKALSFLFNTCHQQQMMIIIICTSCTSIDRKEKRKMNTYFFLLVLQFMMTPIVHCTSSFACLKRMRWNERVYAREKERERESAIITYIQTSVVGLS